MTKNAVSENSEQKKRDVAADIETVEEEKQPEPAKVVSAGSESEAAEESEERGSSPEKREGERHKEDLDSAKQERNFRPWAFVAAYLFAFIPAYLLLRLGNSILSGEFVGFARNAGNSTLIAAFIIGVFASFIAVFGFLIRGAFTHSRQKDGKDGNEKGDAGVVVRAIRDLVRIFSRKD